MAIGTAAAIIGGSVIGGVSSLVGGSKGAKTTKKAADASLAESQRQFDLTRADTAPYREAGVGALDSIKRIFVNGDISALRNDPGYQFSRQEGLRAVDNSLLARGRGLSGSNIKAAERYATGLADQQSGSIFSRLAAIAGIGSGGVNASANAGTNTAGNVANINMNSAASRASSYAGIAGGINNAAQGYLSNTLLQRYLGGGAGITQPGLSTAMNYRGPLSGGGLA